MIDRMVGSWEMPESIPLQFLSFSKAYLDSATQLCDRLFEMPQESSFPIGSVILFLMHHSIELFLKASILTRKKNEKLHHDIMRLKQRYDDLFPGCEFTWDMPFKKIKYVGLEPPQIEKQTRKKKNLPLDQLYRYPTDQERKAWPGVFAFDHVSFSCDIKAVAADFTRLEPIIFVTNKAM